MNEEHAYRVAAWWTSGRTGLAKSDSAPNAIHFTAPTEFGGLEGRWTPEELLLAAIAGCYTTTVRAIAGGAQFDFTDLQVEASGTVRKAESGYSFTQIVVRPNLKIASNDERDRALELWPLASLYATLMAKVHRPPNPVSNPRAPYRAPRAPRRQRR